MSLYISLSHQRFEFVRANPFDIQVRYSCKAAVLVEGERSVALMRVHMHAWEKLLDRSRKAVLNQFWRSKLYVDHGFHNRRASSIYFDSVGQAVPIEIDKLFKKKKKHHTHNGMATLHPLGKT